MAALDYFEHIIFVNLYLTFAIVFLNYSSDCKFFIVGWRQWRVWKGFTF